MIPPLPVPLPQGRGDFSQKLNFNSATLEVDTALWGGFWQGDVISAGYTLPALELAFLRENRLAHTIDASTPNEYFAQLQNSLKQKPMGAWETNIAGQVLRCIAVPESSQWRIIWYTETTIFAGYGSPPITAPGYNLQVIQSPKISESFASSDALQSYAQQILELLSQWADTWQTLPSDARIDRLIQVHRAYSLLQNAQTNIAVWLDKFGR